MSTKKDLFDIEFEYGGETQSLKISVDKSIVKLFANEDTEVSDRYVDTDGDGLEFFAMKEKLSGYVEKYNSYMNNEFHSKFSCVALREYGTNLIRKDKNGKRYANFSILRTVDLDRGIEVNLEGIIFSDDIEEWVGELSRFIRFLHTTFVDKSRIIARLSIDVE